MEIELKQIVVQDESLDNEKRALVQHGKTIEQIQQFAVTYESLTQAEKDLWDSFVNLLISKE